MVIGHYNGTRYIGGNVLAYYVLRNPRSRRQLSYLLLITAFHAHHSFLLQPHSSNREGCPYQIRWFSYFKIKVSGKGIDCLHTWFWSNAWLHMSENLQWICNDGWSASQFFPMENLPPLIQAWIWRPKSAKVFTILAVSHLSHHHCYHCQSAACIAVAPCPTFGHFIGRGPDQTRKQIVLRAGGKLPLWGMIYQRSLFKRLKPSKRTQNWFDHIEPVEYATHCSTFYCL